MSQHDAFPPKGACDCHVHVVGPKSTFPLDPRRSYTPMDATLDDLLATMDGMGIDRAVVVQPSFYGTDNRCTLDAVARLGDRGRAVAVVSEDIADQELDGLHGSGVRGLRLNLVSNGTPDVADISERLARTARSCARNGWHIQIFAPSGLLAQLAHVLAGLPAEVVLDHFALVQADRADQAGLETMAGLLRTGRVWVKLSGTYRVAGDPFDRRLAAVARHFVAANPERVVWGTDWPHTSPHGASHDTEGREMTYRSIDTPRLLSSLRDWLEPDEIARVLVDNPARLYHF